MKRYILFAGNQYYPMPGCDDIVNSFDTIEEATDLLPVLKDYGMCDWACILDIKTGKIIHLKEIK